jgi:hypothetical protein
MKLRGLCLSIALTTTLAHADDAADVAMARTLGVEGFVLADSGKCKEAIDKLARAEKLHHAPTTATRLGECEIEQGALVSGTERLQRVVHESLAANAHPAFVAAVARARVSLNKNLPRLASVRFVVPTSQCKNPSVVVDGEPLSEAAIDGERHIDPGTHHLRVNALLCQPFETTFELLEGQAKIVRADLRVDENASVAASTSARKIAAVEPQGFSEPALWAFGLGAVGLGLGVVGGLVVASRTRTLAQTCDNRLCPPEASAGLASAKTWATVSTIGFVAFAAFGAAGITLLLVSPKAGEKSAAAGTRAVVGLGTVGLQGQF